MFRGTVQMAMEGVVGRIDRSGELTFSAASAGNGSAAGVSGRAVVIVDASRLRRECLRLALLQHNAQWRIAEFATADELQRATGAGQNTDLIVVGAATAELVDLRQLANLRQAMPETPLVVIAESGDPQRARHILSVGARGFLPTNLSLKVLVGALDLVLAGGVYVPSSLLETNSARPDGGDRGEQRQPEPWSELTRRQRDVLALISQGRSNKLIADALAMSESTVKAHVKQIIKRLHVSNRTQAALLATGSATFVPAALNGHMGHNVGAGIIAK